MLMFAGLGTRLRPFTEILPKPLLPLVGIPVAQFAIDALIEAGVETIVANIHHLPEKSREGLNRMERGDARIEISDESAMLLGSAGGPRQALALLGNERFFLLNADVICDVDLHGLAVRHAQLRGQWGVNLTLTLFPSPTNVQESYREIRIDQRTGLITGFGELTKGKPFWVGAAVMEPEALSHVPEGKSADFLTSILTPAVREGKVGYFMSTGSWHDIGSSALWLRAHLEILKQMETGRIHSRWRRRIEAVNRRVGEQLWVSNEVPHGLRTVDWAGAAYFSGKHAPRILGPDAVLYGEIADQAEFRDGIGFGGHWNRSE